MRKNNTNADKAIKLSSNLNLARYIQSADTEDIQDIDN